MLIAALQEAHLPAVARLHCQALAGDFLPSLGAGFLQVFYRAALRQGLIFGWAAMPEPSPGSVGELMGFVIGSADTGRLFRSVVASSAPALAWAALPAVLRRPRLLLKVFETFLYPAREAAAAEKAELLVIAVEPALRSRRVGQALVEALNQTFSERQIAAYKVTVLEANQAANRFYQRLGFMRSGGFRLYGRDWNLYRFQVGEAQA